MNKSVTKYIFPYSSFHAEHDGDIYFHVQELLRKLEGLLQPHVSLFIPPPYPVLSQYIPFYEVRRNIKTRPWSKPLTEVKVSGPGALFLEISHVTSRGVILIANQRCFAS